MTPRGRVGALLGTLAFALGTKAAGATEPAPVPDPGPYLAISGNALAGVSDDGTVVVFRRQKDGIQQLFRTDGKGGAPVQVTKRAEPADFAVLSPDGTRAVVGYDAGGDENSGLYLVGVGEGRDGQERALSAEPGVQHGDVVWSRDGARIFFRSNATSKKDFHLHELRVADGTRRTVLAREGSWHVHDVDPAGARLLVGQFRSARDSSIHVLDLATGTTEEIDPAPSGRTHAVGSARFLGSGDEVVFLSDRVGDFRWPYAARIEDGAVRMLIPFGKGAGVTRGCIAPGEIESARPSPDGRHVALVENVGGWAVLSRLEVATGIELSPASAKGTLLTDPLWTKDGRLFLERSGPTGPTEIVRWDGADKSGPTSVATPDLGPSPPPMPKPPRLVEYPTFDGRRIPAWLYLPASETAARPPFVVSVHGGPEGQERPWFSPDRAYLLSLGFAVLAPNVRGSTGYGRTYRDLDDYKRRLDSVRDVKAAADWLVREELADPKRIAVVGGSYGGYVVLACLTEFPETFAAGVDAVGIANFETFLERTAPYRRALREAEYGPLSDREFLRSISPIHKVDRIRAPLFVAHGENDPRVPVGEARQIEAALRARGVPVRSLYFPDEGHGWQRRENRATYLRHVAQFLRDTIGG